MRPYALLMHEGTPGSGGGDRKGLTDSAIDSVWRVVSKRPGQFARRQNHHCSAPIIDLRESQELNVARY
jgi:hypothetical protein